MTLRTLLRREQRSFCGVVHLGPLPGAPRFAGSLDAVLERACADARALVEGGVDCLIVENFGDAPFHAEHVPAETIAGLARALTEVAPLCGERPLGVNVLRNDARAALGLCASTPASFLRVNVHTGAMVTDQGVVEGRAAETLRERSRLAPEAVLLADVHVKHATPLGSESLEEAADEAFGRGGADALILSGLRTGGAVDLEHLVRVRERLPEAPLWIGSGLTADNAAALLPRVDGAIVGTALKEGGQVLAPVDPARVARLRAAFDAAAG